MFWFFFPTAITFHIYVHTSSQLLRFVIIFSFRLHMHLSRVSVWYGAPFTGTGFFCLHRIVTLFPCMTDSDSDSLALLWLWLCSGTHAHTHQDSFFFLPLLNCSLHLVRLVVPNQCCFLYHFLSLWCSDVEAYQSTTPEPTELAGRCQ